MSTRMFAICLLIVFGVPVRSSTGAEAKDYPGLGRIEGYKITEHEEKRFDRYNLRVPGHAMTVEGHVIHIEYKADGSEPTASLLEIARSYKLAIDSLNSEILNYNETDFDAPLIARFTRNNQNIYVRLAVYRSPGYVLDIVEERSFRPLIEEPPPTKKP